MVWDHFPGRGHSAHGSRLDWIPANGGLGKKSSILGKSPTLPSAQQIVPVSTEPNKAKCLLQRRTIREECLNPEQNVKQGKQM